MFSSVIGLNYYQRYLASVNSQTFEPIRPKVENVKRAEDKVEEIKGEKIAIKNQNNNKQQKLNPLRSIMKIFGREENLGLLELSIRKSKTISIDSGGIKRAFFIKRANGEIKLKLSAPITINIEPPLDNRDKIIWKGKTYLPQNIKDGVYIFNQDSIKSAAAENDLPD